MSTTLHSRMLRDAAEVLKTRALSERSVISWSLVDFDELMALEAIRSRTRLWLAEDGRVGAFAFVDDFNNLRFGVDPGVGLEAVGGEIVEWGLTCIRGRRAESGEQVTLDASCNAEEGELIAFLEHNRFEKSEIRSLHYARSLSDPIPEAALPPGYLIRPARGEQEVSALVDLHRAAFESDWMTDEYRLGMMRTGGYDPELDLVIETPEGKLAAFCIGVIDVEENRKKGTMDGFSDPIGVHPIEQRRGLGKAVLMEALKRLKLRGMARARLGTSSENLAMQRLAESAGFQVIEESLWFSRDVGTPDKN